MTASSSQGQVPVASKSVVGETSFKHLDSLTSRSYLSRSTTGTPEVGLRRTAGEWMCHESKEIQAFPLQQLLQAGSNRGREGERVADDSQRKEASV
jgi:hypothetical protein